MKISNAGVTIVSARCAATDSLTNKSINLQSNKEANILIEQTRLIFHINLVWLIIQLNYQLSGFSKIMKQLQVMSGDQSDILSHVRHRKQETLHLFQFQSLWQQGQAWTIFYQLFRSISLMNQMSVYLGHVSV